MYLRKIVALLITPLIFAINTNTYAASPIKEPVSKTTTKDILDKSSAQQTVVDNKEPQNKDRAKIYHVYDDIDLVAKIDFQYDRPRVIIKTVTPFLSSDVNDDTNVQYFNQAVHDIISDEAEKFKAKVAENQTFQKKLPKKNISNKLFIDFDTAAIDSGKNHIISIRFSVQGYITGLAHPYSYHRVLNFDLDNNTVLEMSDLFNSQKNFYSVLANYSNQALSRRLPNKEMVIQGTAPNPENYKNWNIKPYGLLITFDEAQVAPFGEGAQTVLIPYSKLRGVIASESPLAACLTHKRHCLTDNLLTGGFIDEA